MDIRNVSPDQAHELAMLAAKMVGAAPADKIAAAYVAAYQAIQAPGQAERPGHWFVISADDPRHRDYKRG